MNEDKIRECYNNCKGKKDGCNNYTPLPNEEVCLWYKVLKNDEQKINSGDDCLTFPALENILIENFIEKHYDSDSLFTYDIKRKGLLKNNKIIKHYEELPNQWKELGVLEY